MSRGQGTIEYLVILAVVVVIALVLVTLIATSGPSPEMVSEQQSKLYWTVQPISIVEAVVDSEGDAIFKLKSQENGTLQYLEIDGLKYDVNNIRFNTGDELVIFLQGLFSCAGNQGYYNIKIYYVSTLGLQKIISGTVPLVVNCSDNVSEDDIIADKYYLGYY